MCFRTCRSVVVGVVISCDVLWLVLLSFVLGVVGSVEGVVLVWW